MSKEANRPQKYRILFMGTPEFACPTLEALHQDQEIEIPLVVSQPDAKRGRKMKLTPSPVKAKALSLGLKCETPEKVSEPQYIEYLQSLNLDAVIVLAYGQLLKQDLLDILPDKFLNIHASLLPRWRGAAPIQRALMAGDKETGISFQIMKLKLDSGPVIFEKRISIEKNVDSMELQEDLSSLSADCVASVVKDYLQNKLIAKEQDEVLVTYAKKIDKAEGLIDWSLPAQEIHNQIRGLQWGPGAYTHFEGKRLKLSKTALRKKTPEEGSAAPGQFCGVEAYGSEGAEEGAELAVCISTSSSEMLLVRSLQPEGKPKMSVRDFTNGYSLTPGQRFS